MNPSVSKASTVQSTAPPAHASKLKLILICVVAALAVGAILYGVGFSKGRAQLSAQKADFDARTQALNSQLTRNQQELVVAQNQTRLIQARASLYRTALDLERRNFGTANTHLQESASALGGIQSGQGIDTTRLGALKDTIAKTNINVAVDLEAQRKQALDFAAQLEALTPKQTTPVASTQG